MADSRETERRSTDDVFDDEYAVDDFDLVADGFAPGRVQVQDGHDRWSIHSRDPSIRSVYAHMADAPPHPLAGPSRNSMHKSRDGQNPFSSTEDDELDTADRRSTLDRSHSINSASTAQYAPGIAHRLSTASSARTFGRASPLHGSHGHGPSHPYSMYPQGTNVGRTPSVSTTTSTIRAHRPTTPSQQGPTHPYSMYPQNVSEHDDEASINSRPSHAQARIPVGFPGLTPGYVRRRGTQGEDQDLISGDGHSEQLPPYSEYPEGGVPKTVVLPGQLVTPPSNAHLHVPLIQPQQEQQPHDPRQSMSDQATVRNYRDMEQMDSGDSATTSSNEKSWNEKSWKEKRKTRFCGIPFWWILLSICVVTFIAVVLGASIGGFLAANDKDTKKAERHRGQGTSTTLLDASPIPSASVGPPPPTGVYALSFQTPQAVQSACIANQTYSGAWNCNMYGTPQMAISLGLPPDGSSNFEGAWLYGMSNDTGINYGTQPPSTQYAELSPVSDQDEPGRGGAFYFQTFYDKFVIAPEETFPDSFINSNQKRALHIDESWFTQRQVQAGDKPWFCRWNGTLLEGFIYAKNTSQGVPVTTPAEATESGSAAKSTSIPLTTSTIIEVSSPSSTSTITPVSIQTSISRSYYFHHTQKHRRDNSWSFADLSSFGYVIKIEERRVPDGQQAYCQQYQILDNGEAGAITDPSTGKTITIMIQEDDPNYSAYDDNKRRVKRDPIPGGCHCEWWSGSRYS